MSDGCPVPPAPERDVRIPADAVRMSMPYAACFAGCGCDRRAGR